MATVANPLGSIYPKLEAKSRVELINRLGDGG